MSVQLLSIMKMRRPDDWHVHLRDGEILRTVLPYTSRYFGRAVIMPNLCQPITTLKQAVAYRERIISALPEGHQFKPLMTCYLIEDLNKQDLIDGFNQGVFIAAKLYLANSTTNSSIGIRYINNIYPVLYTMQCIGLPLLVHGELSISDIDIFDREARFIEQVMVPIRYHFPELKIVFEHITTKEAVDYVMDSDQFLGATITPQHLMFNRNHMLIEGIRPHLYCMPILKRKIHQEALRTAIASGFNRFFLGTDTAPHTRNSKESHCGCAGVFNAPGALLAYATVFEEMNAMTYFEDFCSLNGPRFYGLKPNNDFIKLKQEVSYQPALIYISDKETLVPFLAGKSFNWKLID